MIQIATGLQLAKGFYERLSLSGPGVLRKWLIGLEQGTRTRAELVKVFDVLRVLDLTIRLYPATEEAGNEFQAPSGTLDIQPSERKVSNLQRTRQAEAAVQAMRRQDMPSHATLDAMRQAASQASINNPETPQERKDEEE